MNKIEVQQRVLKNGKPLDLDRFSWDEKSKTFSSTENCLVIDFDVFDSCTFITGGGCIFDTGSYCNFDAGSYCIFNTGKYCIFNTGWGCTFVVGHSCTFKTGEKCVAIRRDIYEVIEIPEDTEIKLNDSYSKGYELVKPKTYTVELTEDQINKLGLEL